MIAGLLVLLLFTVLSAQAFEGRVLQRSMQGADVVEIQKALKSLGYNVNADGHFGAQTENAVRTFQQESGIPADGIIGPETLQAMRSAGKNRTHQVRRGDSLSQLAINYSSTIEDIMDANDMTDDTIYIGQKLVIPPATTKKGNNQNEDMGKRQASESGSKAAPAMMTYKVQPGESAYIIAKKFNTTVLALQAVNNLKNPSLLRIGQSILIPPPGHRTLKRSFRWPVKGPISSGYGWRTHPVYKNRQFHGGIDIAVPTGTFIRAAAAGKVTMAKNMGGFGLGIVIDHGGGITTWYGHKSVLLAKAGEKVVYGQIIAKSGNTGVSTGPHLDFRIKVNGNTVNPMEWLN